MRVCIITTKYNFKTSGGSVGDIDLRARFLHERGHDVLVVSAFSQWNSPRQTFPYRFNEERIMSAGLLGIQLGIYRILKKYERDADVFHVDGQVFLYGAGCYRLLRGRVPVLGFFNHWLNAWADESAVETEPAPPFLLWFKKLKRTARFYLELWLGVPLANRMDAFIYNTPQVAEKFEGLGFRKGTVLPDFADTLGMRKRSGTTPERLAVRQQPKGGVVTMLCAGRMLREKGVDLVVKAFAKMPHKERYRIILSGTGPAYEEVRGLVKEYRLEEYVRLPGWVERGTLLDFFRQSQVFIFPDWWLAYGSVALEEAMSMGLASIIPRGGALEWLSGGEALTFAKRDAADLARAMRELGENAELRTEVAARGLAQSARLDYRVLGVELENILFSLATPQAV